MAWRWRPLPAASAMTARPAVLLGTGAKLCSYLVPSSMQLPWITSSTFNFCKVLEVLSSLIL
eukprot:1435933-Rhodomonas_salina.1